MSEYDPHWLKNMIKRVKSLNDPSELIEAINSHPTGLLADEQIREVIIESLRGNHLKSGRGRSPDSERNTRIWIDMKVLIGEGMGIGEASRVVEAILKEEEAEKILNRKEVEQEFAVTAERIRKLYLDERKRRGIDEQAKKVEK